MAGFEISFKGRVRGPISNGRMKRDLESYDREVADAIADSAKDTWVNFLKGSIRKPTPYYWTKIDKRQLSATRYEIHDHDIVYGPWLEGTGSRNRPRPGFPGYHSQEKAEAEMQRKRGNISRRILRRYRSSGRLI